MNRRDFLKLLGVGAAAAVITPARLVYHDLQEQERLVTEYDLVPSGASPGMLLISGFTLEAPAGKLCTAILRVSGNNCVCPNGIVTGNGPAEIAITQIEQARLPMLALEVDATVFNGDLVPVDWGVASKDRPIHIHYRSMSDKDETLLLGLWQRVWFVPSNHGGINA